MKTSEAIEWAKRVYPDVGEIRQLQLANAYRSGESKGIHETQMRALDIVNNIIDKEEDEAFPSFAEESIRLNDEAYDKASSNRGELI